MQTSCALVSVRKVTWIQISEPKNDFRVCRVSVFCLL